MNSKDDLDVSKIKYVYSSCFIGDTDSVIVYQGKDDVTLYMHSAQGSGKSYMIKNASGDYILTLRFDAGDKLDFDITYLTIFPYESYLIVDSSVHNWIMLDFHILWMFGWPPDKL